MERSKNLADLYDSDLIGRLGSGSKTKIMQVPTLEKFGHTLPHAALVGR